MESKISLLDPACRIPIDVTFQVVDLEGQQVGHILEGHKKIMAVKSSAFEAMFYGPLKEDKVPIVIKETTFVAFKNMLNFIHNIVEDWSQVELAELLHMANLAERYHLPLMRMKVQENLKSFTVTEENLLETAATAEEFSFLDQESEALLQACSSCLEDSLATPGDLQKFIMEQYAKDDKQGMVSMRLLARVKVTELAFAGGLLNASNEESLMIWKILSIVKKTKKSSNTLSDLIKLKDLLEKLVNSSYIHYFSFVDRLQEDHQITKSLTKSFAKSIDKAAAGAMGGNQVQPEVMVEGSITLMQSVQVHLDLIKIILGNDDEGNGLWLRLDALDVFWEPIVNKTVPEVHSVFFDWLANNDNMFHPEVKKKMVEKLVSYTGPHSASYHRVFFVLSGE